MTTNIQLLRSSIAYKRPSSAPLLEGQAAINYNAAEPGLFFRLTDGRLSKIGPCAVTDNGLAPNAAPAGEVGNAVGETWLNAQVSLYSPVGYVFDGNEFVTANGFKVDVSTGDFTLMRTLTVQKLVVNELNVDGPAVIGGNITPNGQNCAYFLGKATERWDYAYLCNLDVSKDGLIGNDLTTNRDMIVGRDLTVGRRVPSNLIPDQGITRFLGNSSNQWAGVHTKDFWSYGNTSIGSNCASLLTVNATTTFKCPVTFENTLDINQIGSSCSNTLTIEATTTVKCPITFEGLITLPPTAIPNPIFSGDIILGDGCATSTIDLKGAVTLSCDMLPLSNNAQKIGASNKRLSSLFAVSLNATSLALSAKGTSAVTLDSDPDNTLITKKWTQDLIATSTGALSFWKRVGIEVSTTAANDDLVPNGANCNLGLAGKVWKTVNANSLALVAKGTSAVTIDSDPDNTLITKKWAEDKIGAASGSGLWTRSGSELSPLNSNDVLIPKGANGALGSAAKKWKAVYANDVYTGDLHLKNDKGDWTMIEAEEYLTIRNNKTGKTFKLMMEEV